MQKTLSKRQRASDEFWSLLFSEPRKYQRKPLDLRDRPVRKKPGPKKVRVYELDAEKMRKAFLLRLLMPYWRKVDRRPFIPLPPGGDYVEWMTVNALYYLRYVMNRTSGSIQRTFGVSDKELMRLTSRYAWYPSMFEQIE